jgi:hypothetical protein
MDRLESLGTTLSQITLYDIKSMYNQAKNVVLNVTEMEAKVREATNDEPWCVVGSVHEFQIADFLRVGARARR